MAVKSSPAVRPILRLFFPILVSAVLIGCQAEWKRSLSEAIRSGDEAGSLELISAGVDVNARIGLDGTLLMLAAAYGRAQTVRALLAAGAEVNASDMLGQTALKWAAALGHADVTAALLAAGAEVDSKDAHGRAPLDWAVRGGHGEVIRILRGGEAASFRYLLIDAVSRGDIRGAQAALASGADPNAGVDRGRFRGGSVLFLAAATDQREMARLLISAGADVNATFTRKSHYGYSALMVAVTGNNLLMVRELLAVGAEVNAATPEGINALILAARSASADVVAELLKAGADVDSRVGSGRYAGATPLSLAGDREEIAVLLRAAGAR